jgi:hypothetical protein
VATQLARAGWQGDAFSLVSGNDPTWTRERWERAAAELTAVQRAWQQANTLHRVDAWTAVGEGVDPCGAAVPAEAPLA